MGTSLVARSVAYAGYDIVALFGLDWLTALAEWRFGYIEEKPQRCDADAGGLGRAGRAVPSPNALIARADL